MSNYNYYRLEQLASLGLPSQILIPAFLKELHKYIPSVSNSFCWQNDDGELDNIFDESSNNIAISKFIHLMSATEPSKYFRAVKWLSQLDEVLTSFDFNGNCPSHLAKSYLTILLPMGYVNTCFIPIKQDNTNVRLGVLLINREYSEPEFTQNEREYLLRVSEILNKGLSCKPHTQSHSMDGWEKGLLITDKSGNLHYSCPIGEKLLTLAASSQFNAKTDYSKQGLSVFNNIEQFIEKILNSAQHKQSDDSETIKRSNSWGEFVLQGFLIEDKFGGREQQLGFKIGWQEPFILKLFQQISSLNLTPRQETISLLYAAGDQYKVIAAKLDLSLYTVKEHVKNISDRLEIQSRSGLISHILCQSK